MYGKFKRCIQSHTLLGRNKLTIGLLKVITIVVSRLLFHLCEAWFPLGRCRGILSRYEKVEKYPKYPNDLVETLSTDNPKYLETTPVTTTTRVTQIESFLFQRPKQPYKNTSAAFIFQWKPLPQRQYSLLGKTR